MQVVDVDLVLDGVPAELVGRAVDDPPLHAAAGQPHREAERVVLAAVGPFGRRRAAELAAPDDERVVEQAAGFQVLEQAGDRLVGRRAVAGSSVRRPPCWSQSWQLDRFEVCV